MAAILEKRVLADRVAWIKVDAPLIATKRKAGQFIILRIREDGERIPLTIVDSNPHDGTIELIYQVLGKSTAQLFNLQVGDEIKDILGPLGKPTHIEKFGTVVCVAGGIGAAPILPIAKALKAAENRVITIVGARNKSLLILENELRKGSHELIITTDDGTYGKKGFVTNALSDMIENGLSINLVCAIGPAIMMKMVCLLTKTYNIPTLVSLNTIMIDGTGMCGGCRVSFGGESKFVCCDGPEFDGHKVDFDEMILRLNTYKKYEEEAIKHFEEKHKCKIGI